MRYFSATLPILLAQHLVYTLLHSNWGGKLSFDLAERAIHYLTQLLVSCLSVSSH